MAFRINVQSTIADSRAEVKKKQFNALGLKNKIGAVCVVDSYCVDVSLSQAQQKKAFNLLANPVFQEASTNWPKIKFNWAIEISFLPGVTDNVGATAKETLEDGLKIKLNPGTNVYSSQVFLIDGKISEADVLKIANSLYNPLIQKATIKQNKNLPINLPKVKLSANQKVLSVNLNVNDSDLALLGKQGIKDSSGQRRGPLSLDLESLQAIKNYFAKLKRNPTDIELESLAQTWSEHCKHTIFASSIDELEKGLYKTYIKGATEIIRKQKKSKDFCVSVFTDNAGGIKFDDNFIITHKVETHNTPSALDPFGGAITGIVGVNRDALGFGMGAKPVVNIYGFCVADPEDKSVLYRDAAKNNPMLSAQRIFQGVVAGINSGGNQSGIPTNLGFINFNKNYRGKPLVFAGTVGLIPRLLNGKPSHLKKARPGDYIVMAGGRVGQDGIHGATFSSEELTSGSPSTAVQIGDPITQKKMSDAIVREAREQNLYTSITDDGAGGLSCSVAEMAKESGGCLVELEKVPLKYPGLAPWQIWISESQERMTLAVPKNKWQKFEKLMQSRGVEATVIGQFTNSGKCVVKYKKSIVMDMDMEFLHNGLPKKHLSTTPPNLPSRPSPSASEDEWLARSSFSEGGRDLLINKSNFDQDILHLLSSPNISSYEFITQQYDHEVLAGSVQKPLQGAGRVNAEATITRPVLSSQKGVVLSSALYPNYSDLDSYKMAAASIDSAIRAAVAAGANVNYLALLDNFCWCSSNDPYRLAQLKSAAKACFDYAVAFGTPYISGKDSMFNDFSGFNENGKPVKISIPPTLLISTIGVVPDITKTVSLDAKMSGDLIYILGETNNELGGSEYESIMFQSPPLQGGVPRVQLRGGVVPTVNASKNKKLYQSFYQAVQKNLVASAISISHGGFAAAITKMSIAGNLGVTINLKNLPGNWKSNVEALFSESQGRILVSVNPKSSREFEKQLKGNIFTKIGTVTSKPQISIADKKSKNIVNIKVSEASKAYKEKFKNY